MTDDEIAAEVGRFVELMEQAELWRWRHAQPPTPPEEARQRIDAMRAALRAKHGTDIEHEESEAA